MKAAAVRVRIEAIDRQIALYATEPDTVRIMQAQVARYRGDVTEKGIVIPDVAPDIRETRFYAENGNSLRFLEEVAISDELAVNLHMVKDNEGNQAMSTRIVDAKLLCGVAGDAVAALTAATIALSKAFGWPYNETAFAEIAAEAKRISE